MNASIRKRLDDDRGLVAGGDILLFGLVTMVLTSLVILNAWLAIDTSLAVSAAAREGARAAVEAPGGPEAVTRGQRAINDVMNDYGRPGPSLDSITFAAFERCAPVSATVSYQINLIPLPIFGDFGTHTISATHSEIVDPFRSGDFMGECG